MEEEAPLLEDLRIAVDAFLLKSRAVLNPLTRYETSFADEADMTGPVLMCLLLAFLPPLQSKVEFCAIHGQATVGGLATSLAFIGMSQRAIDLYGLASIPGYSLLPTAIPSFLAEFSPAEKKSRRSASAAADGARRRLHRVEHEDGDQDLTDDALDTRPVLTSRVSLPLLYMPFAFITVLSFTTGSVFSFGNEKTAIAWRPRCRRARLPSPKAWGGALLGPTTVVPFCV